MAWSSPPKESSSKTPTCRYFLGMYTLGQAGVPLFYVCVVCVFEYAHLLHFAFMCCQFTYYFLPSFLPQFSWNSSLPFTFNCYFQPKGGLSARVPSSPSARGSLRQKQGTSLILDVPRSVHPARALLEVGAAAPRGGKPVPGQRRHGHPELGPRGHAAL